MFFYFYRYRIQPVDVHIGVGKLVSNSGLHYKNDMNFLLYQYTVFGMSEPGLTVQLWLDLTLSV